MANKQRRLLHVIGSSKYGGVYEMVFAHCAEARRRGFEPYVLTTDPEGQRHCKELGIALVDFPGIDRPIRPWKDIMASIRLARYLRNNPYDLVLTHVAKGGLVGRLAARMARTSAGVIHTHHGLTVHEGDSRWYIAFFAVIERRASRWCDLVILLTESDARFNRERRFVPEEKTVVIANGIPDPQSALPANELRSQVLRSLDLPEDAFYIGNACRLSAVKHLSGWLRALAMLDEVDGKPVRGLIAGDGELRRALEDEAKKLGLEHRVDFLGFRRDRLAILNACDVFMTTSRAEGMSITVLEAMGLGMPIVATDIRGNRDCIIDGQDGLLVPFDDAAAAAAACRGLLTDDAWRSELGRAARRKFERDYTEEIMIEKTWNMAYLPVLAARAEVVDDRL